MYIDYSFQIQNSIQILIYLPSCEIITITGIEYFYQPFIFFMSILVLFFFFLFLIFGLHLSHLEVPRVGAESELQLPAHTTATATPDLSHVCDLYCNSQLRWILNPLSETRNQMCILMDTSWVHNPVSHSRNSLFFCF